MKALDWMRRLLVSAAICGAWLNLIACEPATNVEDCSALSRRLEGQLRSRCVGTEQTPALTSNYCSVCVVGASLYSYTKSGNGVCVCTPLTFTEDSCASVDDADQLTSAIVAADNECAEFRLTTGGAGSGGGGGTAGTSAVSGSGG